MSKKNLIYVIIALVLIIVSYTVIRINNDSNTNNTFNNSQQADNINSIGILDTEKDIIKFVVSPEYDQLKFPEASLQLRIPTGLVDFTEEEINRYNSSDVNSEYYLWRACRTIFKETNMDFMLLISFDEYENLCATERFVASITESEYQDYGDDFCGNLESADLFPFQQYYGCSNLENPPAGFKGFEFFEYIPDYIFEDVGLIIKETYLENLNDNTKKMILGYYPNEEKRLNIKPSEFTNYVENIKNGKYEIFNSTNENMNIFNEIVSSLLTI